MMLDDYDGARLSGFSKERRSTGTSNSERPAGLIQDVESML